MRKLDLIGQTFGMLVVVAKGETQNQKTYFSCKCECGNTKVIKGSDLRRKLKPTRSCGCLVKFNNLKNPGRVRMNSIYSTYRIQAKERGYEFDLTLDEFETITAKDCHYCGAKPSNKSKAETKNQTDFIYNGIDRVDNKKGYFVDNCVPCCQICNKMKKAMSLNDFKNHIALIYHKFIQYQTITL